MQGFSIWQYSGLGSYYNSRYTNPAKYLLSVTNSMTFSKIPLLKSEKSLVYKDFQTAHMLAWDAVVLPISEFCKCGYYSKHPGGIQAFFVRGDR